MLGTRITAVFPTENSAEAAVKDLRAQGVGDDKLAIIKRHESTAAAAAVGATEGLVAGGAVGAAFGLASLLIPGVGPFIAAGFLAPVLGSAMAGAAATGAIVGGTAGLISGALARAGYSAKESDTLAAELEKGQVILAVDSGAAINDAAVAAIVTSHGGRVFAVMA